MNKDIWYSRALVAAQFLLIALILSPISMLLSGNSFQNSGVILCFVMGAGLALWALTSMHVSNFSVMPEPKEDSQLVTHGPYRHLRHPMYSAVILCCLGGFIATLTVFKFVYLTVLIFILLLKIRREEHLLQNKFAEYERYKHRTSALIPGLL